VKTAPGEQRPYAAYTIASPGYFNAVGTPILRGRDFLPSDSEDAPLVAIINRAMAEKFWPGRDPIGRPVGVPIVRDNMTVVGIVPDVKHQSLRETSAPEVYVPFTQRPWPSMLTMHVAMRGRGDTTALISAAREAVRQVDAELPLASVAPLTDIVDQSIAAPRFLMLLLAALAGIALLLAALGLYGAGSYAVAQRTPELGVRIALGAARRHILATVLGESTRVTCAGIALGVGGALATTRVLSAYLYGVEPSDPVTFAGTAAALVVVSLVACYVPARRATRLDPIRSIRAE
jgi:predicted permease